MNNDLVRIVPQELRKFINQPDNINKTFSQTEILRDSHGRICSICYYNLKRKLTKQVFYIGAEIKSIEHYHKSTLVTREEF